MASESSDRQSELLSSVRSGVAGVAKSRQRVELQISNLRQVVVTLDGQARAALGQGREDLARKALSLKAVNQKKLSELETRFQELMIKESKLLARVRLLDAQAGAAGNSSWVPGLADRQPREHLESDSEDEPSAKTTPESTGHATPLTSMVQQMVRWHREPGGTAFRALDTDVRDVGSYAREVTAARRAADGPAVEKALLRLRAVCVTLASDVAAAMGAPPMPDVEAQRWWATALVDAQKAAADIRAYAEGRDMAGASQAAHGLRAFKADIDKVSERFRVIKDASRLADLKASLSPSAAPATQLPSLQVSQQREAAAERRESTTTSLDSLLAQLDGLTGLAPEKAAVRPLTDMVRVAQMRRAAGLPVTQVSRHLVFTGNPGTGKTTVARLLAQIYAAIGVLPTGQLVEVTRSDLVAGYVGQTAIKTTAAVNRALGGILFIDEAYALARSAGSGQDFGQEAVDTLVNLMEDNRDQLVVIVAGYDEEMAHFINANPGLPSRFPRTIYFPDYSTDELVTIFEGMCGHGRYEVSQQTLGSLREYLAELPRMRGFGNGRLVRNTFEAALARQASRIVASCAPDLTSLTLSDLGLPTAKALDRDATEASAGPYI